MYIAMIHNHSSTSARSATANFDGEDSKYAVADILSTFAGAENATPLNLSTALSPTPTTDLLTPTTLANLEQTFLELQSTVAPTATSSSLPRESGFVPPVLGPNRPTTSQMVKQEYDYSLYQDDSSQDPDWTPSGAKRPRYSEATAMSQAYESEAPLINRRRRKNDEQITPEEEARRNLRRERNKLAAAKCRQRRVDLTNKLIFESEGLEEEQSKLENEIQMLQQQKEQLEFLLDAHKPVCSAGVTHTSSSSTSGATTTVSDPQVTIKTEKVDFSYPSVLTTATIGTSTNQSELTCSSVMSRPNTLLIPSSVHASGAVTEATGVPITTPSGVFNFGLESMLDGHTGLTPITGTPSCASQMHRASTDGSSSPSENLSSPTTLLAL